MFNAGQFCKRILNNPEAVLFINMKIPLGLI